MAWSSEITQYVGWNYEGDSLVMESFLGILGLGADSGKLLFITETDLSSPRWHAQINGPTIKFNHPFFLLFTDSNGLPYYYDGWLYSEMPTFKSTTNHTIFKSKSGDWVYSQTQAEPYLYLSTSSFLFAPYVEDGMDVRDISVGLVNPNECFKCEDTTPEEYLDQYADLSYTFKDYKLDSPMPDVKLESHNYAWTLGGGTVLHHEEGTSQYKQLSTYLGLYEMGGVEPTVFGTAYWKDDELPATMHGNGDGLLLRAGYPGFDYLEATLGKEADVWKFTNIIESTGIFENPTLLSSSSYIACGEDALISFTAGIGNKAYAFYLEWDGYGIGGNRGNVRFAQPPWYRQEERED